MTAGRERDAGDELPADLIAYRDTYAELFGDLPPLPAAKFAVSAHIDPDFVRASEALRAHAFAAAGLDQPTVQLIAFAVLLASGSAAAEHHARAALRLGVSPEALQHAVAVVSAVMSLGPANLGAKLLGDALAAGVRPG